MKHNRVPAIDHGEVSSLHHMQDDHTTTNVGLTKKVGVELWGGGGGEP